MGTTIRERYGLSEQEANEVLTAFAVYRYKGPTYRRRDQRPAKKFLVDLIALTRLFWEIRTFTKKDRKRARNIYTEYDLFVRVWTNWTPRAETTRQ